MGCDGDRWVGQRAIRTLNHVICDWSHRLAFVPLRVYAIPIWELRFLMSILLCKRLTALPRDIFANYRVQFHFTIIGNNLQNLLSCCLVFIASISIIGLRTNVFRFTTDHRLGEVAMSDIFLLQKAMFSHKTKFAFLRKTKTSLKITGNRRQTAQDNMNFSLATVVSSQLPELLSKVLATGFLRKILQLKLLLKN